jgi:hypothetical protein
LIPLRSEAELFDQNDVLVHLEHGLVVHLRQVSSCAAPLMVNPTVRAHLFVTVLAHLFVKR